MVDDAVQKGLIKLGHTENPVQTVLDIVNLVAVDHPIGMVSRIKSSFQKVMSCHQGRTESLNSLVFRFRRLAAKYMNHKGADASSQTGQMLAITLLNNTKLDESTTQNAMLQLLDMEKSGQAQNNTEVKNAEIHQEAITF